MSKRSPYILAALASAVAPHLDVVAVNDAHDLEETGRRKAIDISVALDGSGAEYDIAVSSQPAVGPLLQKRLLAAKLLERTEQVQALGFRCEGAVAAGEVDGQPVIITRHLDGLPLPLADLNPAQCSALGTAIAAIHLLKTDFLTQAAYPVFDAQSIRADLTDWTARLTSSVEVPGSIVERWQALASVDGLWDFTPRVVHGSFYPNDVLFHHDSVWAVRNWENIQVSDPARDFAWAYEDNISEQQRDALLSAYGRMMGSQMDTRIVPRARLWRQMDTVRDLLQALAAADRPWIRSARERIEALDARLAPQVPVTPAQVSRPHQEESSTITVGALLTDSGQTPEQAVGRAADVKSDSALAADSAPDPVSESFVTSGSDQARPLDPALVASREAATAIFARPVGQTDKAEPTNEGQPGNQSSGANGQVGLDRLTDSANQPRQAKPGSRQSATDQAAVTSLPDDLRASRNYVSLVDEETATAGTAQAQAAGLDGSEDLDDETRAISAVQANHSEPAVDSLTDNDGDQTGQQVNRPAGPDPVEASTSSTDRIGQTGPDQSEPDRPGRPESDSALSEPDQLADRPVEGTATGTAEDQSTADGQSNRLPAASETEQDFPTSATTIVIKKTGSANQVPGPNTD